jgi:hypothetical protein
MAGGELHRLGKRQTFNGLTIEFADAASAALASPYGALATCRAAG